MIRNYDGVIAANEFSTKSTWYKIGFEHGRDGVEYSCRAGDTNPHARIDYQAGRAAGEAARAEKSA